MRIPSWLGAAGPLHSEAVYIGADRFRYPTVFACNQATDHTYTPELHSFRNSPGGLPTQHTTEASEGMFPSGESLY